MTYRVVIASLLALMSAACGGGSSGSSSSSVDNAPTPHPGSNAEPAAPRSTPTQSVAADFHTLSTPPLEAGQFELITLSTLPDTVTGGDVLLGLRGLASDDKLQLWLNGEVYEAPVETEPDGLRSVLVSGLKEGENLLTARATGPAGTREAALKLRNHPISGPVITGPHQEPFYCRTEEAGLGEPLDANCSIETRYQWFYRGADGFQELEDPYAPYPADLQWTTLSNGEAVPFVVRVESATINRGITRIAVLDDPHARGPKAPFAPNWNRDILYAFGESCGVGYHQGVNTIEQVLGSGFSASGPLATLTGIQPRLAGGDMIVHSTMSTLGVNCNDALSAETVMMIKEHITERYGRIRRLIGTGSSGGAIQQYTAANNYPGLISAGAPSISFPDIITTAMSAHDCGLLAAYFREDPTRWTSEKRNAVTGHLGISLCNDWNLLFTPHLEAGSRCDNVDSPWCDWFWEPVGQIAGPYFGARSCDPSVPAEAVYHPVDNPGGVRCTLQDATVNLWGRDPATGFARRPVDNVGVQYGLHALNSGKITVREFLDLNRDVGGYDIDGNIVDERSRMDAEVAHLAYLTGRVTGRGALAETPLIDLNVYLDMVPILGFHDQVRPYMIRDRLSRSGPSDSHSIWNGFPAAGPAYRMLHAWLDRLSHTHPLADRADQVRQAKAEAAGDRCSFNLLTGYSWLEPADMAGKGWCGALFRPLASPRMVAGGPLAEDNIKCELTSVDPADYAVPLSEAELAELREIFPEGICDWSRPPVGSVEKSLIWASIGGEAAHPPQELHWRAARSEWVGEDDRAL